MGEDGETFPSSNFDKLSVEGASEQQHSIGEEKLNGRESNDAEQCEFVPDSNVSPFDSKDSEELAEEAGQGGFKETGDMHAADEVEGKIRAEEEVGGGGGGPILTEKVGGENSDFTGVDEAVVNEEDHAEGLAVQDGPVVATEEVEELGDMTDSKEDATTGGDGEKNDSDLGVVGRSHSEADEVEAVTKKLITESDNLQSTAADGSGTVEEEAAMVGKPVESSVVMVGAQKESEAAEGKETNAEEMLITEVKLNANAENVSGLRGLESVGDLPQEEMNQVGGKEGLVADTEMDGIKGSEGLENFGSNDLQSISQEPVNEKVNKEWLPGGIPIADSVLEEEKEAETEDINVDSVDSIHKPDDADAEMVAEDGCAAADMGVETETYVVEERGLLGMGKEAETETVEVGDAESNLTGDGKHVSQDEDKKVVAKEEEPAFIGSEMETKTDAEEEPRTLVIEQGEEAETKIAEVGDIASIPKSDDANIVSLGEEDGEPVAEAGSNLDGLEMETQIDAGEEEQRLQMLEKEKEAETETVEVDNVEYIDDVNHVPQDEGDEEIAAEESALADTEMETETDVGESGRAVGEKHKRGTNAKGLTKSKTASKSQKITEEDVCFICFDGGDLFLCDRR